MGIKIRFVTSCALALSCMGAAVAATSSPTTMSQYGLIQNVQNYSSNPFWNSNSPYNQRMPVPVYATGTDLNAGDCQRTVATLVAQQCAARNNCVGMQLSDIRPAIMIQLSRMPGHNYATSCGGYIDTEFNAYVSKYGTAAPNGTVVAFPAAGAPNNNATAGNKKINIQNPYAPQAPTWNGESWFMDKKDREKELATLQAQNDTTPTKIVAAEFPKTISDVSLVDRMNNAAAGYEPYRDLKAYHPLNVESEEAYWAREQARRLAMGMAGQESDKSNESGNSSNDGNGTNPSQDLQTKSGEMTDAKREIINAIVGALPD